MLSAAEWEQYQAEEKAPENSDKLLQITPNTEGKITENNQTLGNVEHISGGSEENKEAEVQKEDSVFTPVKVSSSYVTIILSRSGML